MTDDKILDELTRIHDEFQRLLREDGALPASNRGNALPSNEEVIDDFIYTEQQEKDWLDSEPAFTKRIYTPLPTKQRRRVTLRKVT